MVVHKCSKCDYESEALRSVIRHEARKHDLNVVWYECEEEGCDYKAKEEYSLKRHNLLKHQTEDIDWYECDQDGCDYKAKLNTSLVSHQLTHDIGVTWYECNQEKCDFKSKDKQSLSQHKANLHEINITWYVCDQDCDYKAKDKKSLTRHKQLVHDINVNWFVCEQEECDFKTKLSTSLTSHLLTHDIGVTWYECDQEECDFKTKTKQTIQYHKVRIHNIDVIWYECDQEKCDYKGKDSVSLKRHRANIHNIDVIWYECDQKECYFKSKSNGTIKRHKSNIHNIDVKWIYCPVDDCDYKCKDSMKQHLTYKHDIGEHPCDFCCYNRNSSIEYKDKEGTHKICRYCYYKVTGKVSRIEKIWSDYLDKKYGTEFLKVSDQRVMGESCQLYRPDKLYASPGLVIHKECDEHQHKRKNGDYACDEKRISDIYDEFPGNKYIVTRWNPHTYKTEDDKLDRKQRLKLDLYVTKKISKIYKKLPQIFIVYMFYDSDNPRLSKNIPHVIVNNKQEFKTFLKSKYP